MVRWWNGRAGEAVALWSVSGAERAAEGALIGNCRPRAKMGRLAALGSFFVIPQSTRWQAAGRALRFFRGSGALAVSCGITRAIRADRDAIFEPAARKMTGVRWSHLMH